MKFSYYADLYLKFGKKEWKNSTFVKNVSLSQSLLNAIDKVTSNRSQFLSEAANLKLNRI